MHSKNIKLTGLRPTARRLGVPSKWLRDEAKAGHVPHICAGSKFLFDPDQVEIVLIERLQAKRIVDGGRKS